MLGIKRDECEACAEEFPASRMRGEVCEWCLADEEGRPHGTCRVCEGARAADQSCACRPPRG